MNFREDLLERRFLIGDGVLTVFIERRHITGECGENIYMPGRIWLEFKSLQNKRITRWFTFNEETVTNSIPNFVRRYVSYSNPEDWACVINWALANANVQI